jgi:nitrogen fixation NifU-like protein
MSLYSEELIEEARNPKHFGELEHAQEHLDAANPTCGDEISLHIRWNNAGDAVEEATFTGRGCMVTMAAASRLLAALQGMPRAELEALTEDAAVKFFADPVTPGRLDCVLLPYLSLRKLQKGEGSKE